MDFNFGYEQPHPQSKILRKHITRAVQDMFLIALRKQVKEFSYIFNSAEEIDDMCSKMIRYWESEEEYEVCAEILKLTKDFKRGWKRRKPGVTDEKLKLMEIFKQKD